MAYCHALPASSVTAASPDDGENAPDVLVAYPAAISVFPAVDA